VATASRIAQNSYFGQSSAGVGWGHAPRWADRLTPRDQQAITPLIWDHVNPYGRYELDMDSRIPILT
jgi:hypothetical protein